MKKGWIKLIIIIAVITIPVVIIRIYKSTYRAEAVSMTVLDDSVMKKTMISPHMEQDILKGTNILYCSTFQLCWNEMKNFMKGNIELSGNPEIVSFLNKSLSTKDDISANSYVAVAGYIKDNIEDIINDQLESKFDNAEPVNFDNCADDDIIAYAYLYKKLRFDTEFESLDSPIEFAEGDGTVSVDAFGIKEYSFKNEKMGDQVEIIDYQNDNDFIIKLLTDSPNDELILAKVKPESTLLETIEDVNRRINNGQYDSLRENDVLKIPKFSFKLSHQYSELIGKKILTPAFSDYLISEVKQDITFVLDERGAIFVSKSLFTATKGIDIARHLVFDQPFLLYMKERGARYPYFAMWVENTELMAIDLTEY